MSEAKQRAVRSTSASMENERDVKKSNETSKVIKQKIRCDFCGWEYVKSHISCKRRTMRLLQNK